MFTSIKSNFALVAALSLSVACTAPVSTDTYAPEAAEQAPQAQKNVVYKSHTIADDGTIQSLRASIAPHHKKSVSAASPEPQRYIPSSGSFVINPRSDSALSIELRRDHGTVGDAVTTVESSDARIASVQLRNGSIEIVPSGVLGNTYVTMFDGQGNATSKFMVLSAVAKEGTFVIRDSSIMPVQLQSKSGALATNFVDRLNDDVMVEVADESKGGLLQVDDPAALSNALRIARHEFGGEVNAVYFQDADILFHLSGSARTGAMRTDLSFTGTLVGQADFEQYVDFGGNLSSSPLRDKEQVIANEYSPQHGKALAHEPTVNAIVLKDGRSIAGNSAMLYAPQDVAYYDVTYARVSSANGLQSPGEEEDEDIGPLHCRASAKATIEWNTLITVENKVDAHADWNHGSPDIGVSFQPHMRIGGELKVGGAVKMGCEMELVKVPLAEWGVPLLGNVKLNLPVKVESTWDFDGKAGLISPRLEIGAETDQSQAGAVGFQYSSDAGFRGIQNVAAHSTGNKLQVTKDSVDYSNSFQGDFTSGIGAGLELEAEVKVWLFKAKVSASIADIMFGAKLGVDCTFDGKGHYEGTREGGIGLFTTVAPTFTIDLKFFKASIRLFDAKIPTLWISSHDKSEFRDDLTDDVAPVTTAVGSAMLYSDALVLDNNTSFRSGMVLVRDNQEYLLTAAGGQVNLAGMPLKSGDVLSTQYRDCAAIHGDGACVLVRKPFYAKP